MEQQLRQLIETAIAQTYPGVVLPTYSFSHPEQEAHGDYATNIALALAKSVGANPRQVAETIVAQLPAHPSVADIEVAGPGFINFRLTPNYFLTAMQRAGQVESTQSETVLFEFGTANTHKVPHIGHLFSYMYGESCVRLLKAVGNTVHPDNYQGDVGLHVAKCLWAYQKNQQPDPETLEEKVAYLQQCYRQGYAAYEDDATAKEQIDNLTTLIYQKDPVVSADWEKTRSWSVAYYKQFEERIGVSYDVYYYESMTHELGTKIVKEKVGEVFEEDQGAIIFRGEPYGLHTRVFINRLGNPTYEAKDIGLAALKRQDWQFDKAIITTAVEQSEYWRVLIKAIELVFPDYVGKLKHIGFGMINLTTGKMSSRSGNILTAFSLVELVKERVKEYIQANRNYSPEETDRIAELVAIGAIKYSFLKSAAGKNITFDLESSIAFEGNSGPYLQYTYARCQSVLAKAGQPADAQADYSALTLNNDEIAVLRWLDRYNEAVQLAATQCAPHVVCGYLFELAQRYSYFYNQHQILTDDKETTAFRLALTQAVGETLKQGLNLLGIQVSDRI